MQCSAVATATYVSSPGRYPGRSFSLLYKTQSSMALLLVGEFLKDSAKGMLLTNIMLKDVFYIAS